MRGPHFVLERVPTAPAREALRTGRAVRDRAFYYDVRQLYVPVRIKPRYWTSQVIGASVIHIATGRGVRVDGGDVIYVEPHCYGRVEWPRALSSPAAVPERRLCPRCLERAHEAESVHAGREGAPSSAAEPPCHPQEAP